MGFVRWIGTGLLVFLVACGPADANQAAQEAASAAGVAVPSDAAEQADAALGEAASALASAGAEIEQAVSAALSDADLEALTNEAVTTIQGLTPADLRLNRDQPLVLDTTQQVAGVTNYRWVITGVPSGAESVRGSVISENSNGKLTLAPEDYAKYFPVAGNYTVDLELTYADGKKERSPITIMVP